MKTADAAQEFLAQRKIAVTGVSREAANHASNAVYQRLKERGYTVYAVNPHATTVEGDTAYASLGELPEKVDGVVIGTRPEQAAATVRECIDLGITRVWMHRGIGKGSVSPDAAELGRSHGLQVIEGGCPCMFPPTDDGAHRFLRRWGTLTGSVPRHV